MKRPLVPAVILAFCNVIVAHAAASLPRTAQCRGVSSAEVFDLLRRSAEDPAKTAAKSHLSPRTVACASSGGKTRRKISPHGAAPSSPPHGVAAFSRALGAGTIENLAVGSDVYTGPPPVALVHPVHTRPLREMPPIPPPRRGDGEDHEHPEPIRPQPPTDDSLPDTAAHQTTFGSPISAPTATGLGFDGVGVGLAGFVPSSNPPDVNGRV